MPSRHVVKIYKDSNDEYRWSVTAGNNERVSASTQGYKRKNDALVNLATSTGRIFIKNDGEWRLYLRNSKEGDPDYWEVVTPEEIGLLS